MKYSLRSLMIVITLVCVMLGGVAARIECLRRWAAFHEREQARHLGQWRQDYGTSSIAAESDEREMYFHHKALASQYRQAAYRPWTVVHESPPKDSP